MRTPVRDSNAGRVVCVAVTILSEKLPSLAEHNPSLFHAGSN